MKIAVGISEGASGDDLRSAAIAYASMDARKYRNAPYLKPYAGERPFIWKRANWRRM